MGKMNRGEKKEVWRPHFSRGRLGGKDAISGFREGTSR